jgi:GxxExxY protein
MQNKQLTKIIIGCAFAVHNVLGSGFLEKVYENALRIELLKHGLTTKQQQSIQVTYEGEVVGDFIADLWVEDQIIIEIKAVQKLVKAHEVQLVNYLTATGIDIGLLINFGRSVEVKRKHRIYTPQKAQQKIL